jgi:hypothetical protein
MPKKNLENNKNQNQTWGKKGKKDLVPYLQWRGKKIFWRKRLKFRVKKLNYKIKKPLRRGRNFFNALFSQRINIRVRGNNIFCTLVSVASNKIIYSASAGVLRVKTTAKVLKKYALNRVLSLFCKKVKKYLTRGGIVFYLIVPVKSRKRVIQHVKRLRAYKKFINLSETRERVVAGHRRIFIKFFSKKIYNGCRAPKAKRKKKNRKLKG